MPIPFTCPHCQHETQVAERFAGQSGRCVECGKRISVPHLDAEPVDVRRDPQSWFGLGAVLVLACIVLAGGGVMIATMALLAARPQFMGRQSSADTVQCVERMQAIADAIAAYVADHGHFPPAYLEDENGKRLHSWRVLLLPYLGYQELYDQIDFDAAWDSPANQRLHAQIPLEYQCPADATRGQHTTSYLGLAGGRRHFFYANHRRTLAEITDGASLTAMIVESVGSSVHWMEPRDLDLNELGFTGQAMWVVGSRHIEEWFHVITADGRVRRVASGPSFEELQAMATVNGGEAISPLLDVAR